MIIPQYVADAIVDPSAYADGARIDEAFKWLRQNAPLAQINTQGFDRFWAVTRHSDIQAVERLNDSFHSADRSVTLTTVEADRRVREMNGGSPHPVRTLSQMDNPDHFAYRKLTQGAFLPQNLRAFEPRVREIARDAVDRMAAKGGSCDFASEVALLYPLRVIMELLGVPQCDEPIMLKLTQEIFASADPDLNRSGEMTSSAKLVEDMQQSFAEFGAYFATITEDRRRFPRDDLASIISNSQIDGKPIGDLEAMSYYIIIATAGHDTTSNTVAGGLWALAERPDQMATLKDDLSLIPRHVEESIRWETPVKHFMRTAAENTELSGQPIAKGDWLMLCYPSGNRDEAVFDNPFQYDVARTPNKHVSFGYGAHICLGQHLGRLEMRILWEELIPRLKSLELDGRPTRTKSNFVCGPKALPIRFEMNS